MEKPVVARIAKAYGTQLQRFLIIYAWMTMLYRLTLFLGIALLVYHLFPKVIGIAAGLVEVVYFIALPVVREVSSWPRLGLSALLLTRRFATNAAVALLIIAAMVLPLDRHAHVPAIAVPEDEAWLYPPEPAVVADVRARQGSAVRRGDVIYVLKSDALDEQLAEVRLRLELITARLQRAAGDTKELAQSAVMSREMLALQDEAAGLEERDRRLVVRAPVSGWITDMPQGLRAGVSVGTQDLLAHIAGQGAFKVEGLASESDSRRLSKGAEGVFVADSGTLAPMYVRLLDVGTPGAQGAPQRYLSSLAGGPVAMEHLANGDVKPLTAVLPLTFETNVTNLKQVVPGTVIVEAVPTSFAVIAMRRVVGVFLRESGF